MSALSIVEYTAQLRHFTDSVQHRQISDGVHSLCLFGSLCEGELVLGDEGSAVIVRVSAFDVISGRHAEIPLCAELLGRCDKAVVGGGLPRLGEYSYLVLYSFDDVAQNSARCRELACASAIEHCLVYAVAVYKNGVEYVIYACHDVLVRNEHRHNDGENAAVIETSYGSDELYTERITPTPPSTRESSSTAIA